ncbi:MAG: DUF58 domain-containing protein [Phormidesmis sp. RL_2_1]|nr:DUF58 domain-containing protein [Phormidesmis sp. RL_2_1]
MNRLFYRLLRFNHRLKQWLLKGLTPSGLGLLGCLLMAGMIGLDIKRSLSYQVFAFTMALMGVAVAASRFGRCRLRATRSLPRFGTVGMPLRYQVLLHNPTRHRQRGLTLMEAFADTFPSFQDFQRISQSSNNSAAARRAWLKLLAQRQWAIAPTIEVPPLAANGETEVRGEVMPLRRGLLSFKTLTMAHPDPLGLVNHYVTLDLPQTVLILPKRYQLPYLDLPGARRHQAGGLALASSVGDSTEFRALREYRPGDSPRKIHWKSWAKIGNPIIKEEEAEYSVRHGLILDTFQSDGDSDERLEEAVAIAASFVCTLQTGGPNRGPNRGPNNHSQSQETLLDTVFVGLQAHCFTIGRTLGNTERLLALLASVGPCPDQPFSSLLPIVQERLSVLSGCICIFLDWDRDRIALVEQLQAAGIPILVLVISDEQGLTDTPDMSCLCDRHSSLHILHLGRIQADLSAL